MSQREDCNKFHKNPSFSFYKTPVSCAGIACILFLQDSTDAGLHVGN